MNLSKPDFTLTAVEKTKAYAKDTNVARKKYDEKVVRLTGKIIELKSSNYEIHLQGDGKQTVVARMGDENYPKTEKVKKVGDQIILQGIASPYLEDELTITLAFMVPE